MVIIKIKGIMNIFFGPEIFQTIYTCYIISILSLWLQYKKQCKSRGFDSCDRPSNVKLDTNRRFFSLCGREIWWMTSKNNRALLVYYIKLCASFQIHRWSQTWVTVRKRSIWVKISDFFVLCDLEIRWMTPKNNRAPLLYQIKLYIISKPSVNLNWSYSPETLYLGQRRRFFVLCDLKIWRITLKNNRSPLLCCFKLCASFHSHW